VSSEVNGRHNWSGYNQFSVQLMLLHMAISMFLAAIHDSHALKLMVISILITKANLVTNALHFCNSSKHGTAC
jgi:hypothetical protein